MGVSLIFYSSGEVADVLRPGSGPLLNQSLHRARHLHYSANRKETGKNMPHFLPHAIDTSCRKRHAGQTEMYPATWLAWPRCPSRSTGA